MARGSGGVASAEPHPPPPRPAGVAERLAGGLDDAPPVGVAAEEGGLDERRIGDGARDALGFVRVARAVHREPHGLGRALAVGDHADGEG